MKGEMHVAKAQKSISELEQLLESQKKRLATLQKRKDQLASQLTKVDGEIASLVGQAKAPTEAPRPRRRGGKSLREFILETLGQSAKPLSARELTEAVLAAGYRTTSKNPTALVRQIVYRDERIEKKEAGKFVLGQKSSAPRANPKKKASKAK